MSDLPPRRRRRRTLVGLGAVLLLVVLVTAWQAWTVRSALLSARDDLKVMAEHLDGGDQEAAMDAASRADEATARADWHTHTPVWWVSQYIPLVGDDVEAVRTVSAASHDLTDGVVSPVVEAGLTPEGFKPVDGRIPIEPLRQAGAVLEETAPRVAEVDRAVAALKTSGLVGPVQGPVEEFAAMLSDAARVSKAAAIATQLLPGMLGGEGDRTYLLMFQNNAEARATGGMPGTLGVLTARDGRLAMRTLPPQRLENGEPVAQRSQAERQLFGRRMVLRARAANVTPHFPRVAELLTAYWDRSGRPPLDGVLAIDPVGLSYLMEYTGPVTLEDGSVLTSDNVVSALLKDSYSEIPRSKQDAYFADAADKIFDAVIGADGSARTLIRALAHGIEERRLAVWSADPEEQALLSGQDVANELPHDTGRPELGLYVNDERADKLSYYLHRDLTVTPSCSDTGAQQLDVSLTLSSSAPESGLTRYVSGWLDDGLPRLLMSHDLLLVAPEGGQIESVTLDGEQVDGAQAVLGDRPAVATNVRLEPQQERTLRYVVHTGEDQTGDIRVLSTPLADGTGGEAFVDSGC